MKERREQRRKKEESYTIKQTKIHNNLNGLEKYLENSFNGLDKYMHVHVHLCCLFLSLLSFLIYSSYNSISDFSCRYASTVCTIVMCMCMYINILIAWRQAVPLMLHAL